MEERTVTLGTPPRFDREIAQDVRRLVRERNRVSPERMGAFRRFLDRYLDRYLEPELKEQIEIHLDGLEA